LLIVLEIAVLALYIESILWSESTRWQVLLFLRMTFETRFLYRNLFLGDNINHVINVAIVVESKFISKSRSSHMIELVINYFFIINRLLLLTWEMTLILGVNFESLLHLRAQKVLLSLLESIWGWNFVI